MFFARWLRLFFWTAGFMAAGSAVVCADFIAPPPPLSSIATNTAQTLDNWRDQANVEFQHVARQLDSFFKRADAPDSASNSTARVRLMLKLQDGETPSPGAAFNGKLALPYAEQQLHLFVDNIRRGTLPGNEDPTYGDESVQVGARWWLMNAVRAHLHLEGGIRFHGIPDPFTQLEFEYERKLANWTGRFTQDIFYYAKEGAGELSQVDVERVFKNKSHFRSTTAANFTEESNGVEFEQTFIYDLPIKGNCRNLIPSASVFAHKSGAFLMDNYRANITYRTRFFRPWLILEVTPQIEFPRERDYVFTPSLRLGFEIWLGSLPEDR